jgi:hypothetical protein
MTVRMYADRNKWPLKEIRVALTHSKNYANDCLGERDVSRHLSTRTLREPRWIHEIVSHKQAVHTNSSRIHGVAPRGDGSAHMLAVRFHLRITWTPNLSGLRSAGVYLIDLLTFVWAQSRRKRKGDT